MNREQLKQQLVEHYRYLRQHGCNDSHSGNASFRFHDEIWVTPTGCCADTLVAKDLVKCHINGTAEGGGSLDAPLHIQIYQNNPKTQAVIHSHGPHAIALSLKGEDFIPIDFEGQHYFPVVPVFSIPYDRYVELSPAIIAKSLAEHKVAMVKGHGVYASGETINLAYKWNCSVELSAKIAWLSQQNK